MLHTHTHTHTHTQELVHAAHTLVRTPAASTSAVEARSEDRRGGPDAAVDGEVL